MVGKEIRISNFRASKMLFFKFYFVNYKIKPGVLEKECGGCRGKCVLNIHSVRQKEAYSGEYVKRRVCCIIVY